MIKTEKITGFMAIGSFLMIFCQFNCAMQFRVLSSVGLRAYIKDPDGYIIEVGQLKPDAPDTLSNTWDGT